MSNKQPSASTRMSLSDEEVSAILAMRGGGGATEVLLKAGKVTLEETERLLISRTLAAFDGNRTKASKALGISRSTLNRKVGIYEAASKKGDVA